MKRDYCLQLCKLCKREERRGAEPASAEGGQNLWFFLDCVCHESPVREGDKQVLFDF